MNIAFVTLLLGLLSGPQEVRLSVGGGVAAVELRLDGAFAARAVAPPWAAFVDFGPEILPRDLEAIAFDSEEHEVGRARIRVNMPRPRAGASFVVERPDQTGRQMARLAWESTVAATPRTIRITLDEELLDVEDPSRFEIPPGEPGQTRILRADLRFGNNISAVAEAFLGSHDRDYTSAELTAVAVLLTGRKELPPPERLSGWFVADDRPLRVVVTEEGPADVVFLVDPAAEKRLLEIVRVGHWKPIFGTDRKRQNFRLEKDHLVTFILPAPERTEGTPYNVFPAAGPFSRSDGGLLWLYFNSQAYRPMAPEAAAFRRAAPLTGTAAITNGRRRAAVWILSSLPPADLSDLEPARRYLQVLNVPLFIWRVSPDGRPSSGSGGDLDASTPDALDSAISHLEMALNRQRIVWVEGNPLPQKIVLTPRATGIDLAR
jgi:hypothetical protein